MVTYKNGNHTVNFVINYNNYPVVVRLDDEHVYELGKYAFDSYEEVK